MVKLRFNLSCLFFLFSLLFVSCNIEWFSDFKNEQEAITTNEFTFYLDNPDSTSSFGLFYKKSLKLGQVYTLKDLLPSSEFLSQMVGYDFVGWKIIDTEYENVVFNEESYLSSIKAGFTSYSFYGEWKPSTNTHYTVRYFFEKIGGSVYEENKSLKQSPFGTTNEEINVESLKTSFGDGFTFSKVEYDEKTQARIDNGDEVVISPKGDTVISLYYERNKFSLAINLNYEGANSPTNVLNYYESPIDLNLITEANPRDHYKLAYWARNPDGTERFTGETMPAENLTLYAIWIYRSNTYYVSTTGRDVNEGSEAHPLATVKRAVEAVIAMNNDEVQPYTICIMDGAQNWVTSINYSKPLNLTIKGQDNNDVSGTFTGAEVDNSLFTINGNSSKRDNVEVKFKNMYLSGYTTISDIAYFNVNNAKVIFENCKIREGRAGKSAINIGSGADVTLKDCKILQNTSNDSSVLSGCGIINNGKLNLSGNIEIKTEAVEQINTVLLSAGNKFYIADDFDPLSKIYFTLSSYPEYNSVTGKITPVAITDSVTADYSSCFVCASEGYTVMQDETTGELIVTKTLSLGSSEIRFYDDVAVTVSYTGGKVKFQTSVQVSAWDIKVYNSYGVDCSVPESSIEKLDNSAQVELVSTWPSGTYNVSISFEYNGVIYSDSVLVTK